MIFQILDANYIYDNEKNPVIKLYGKTKEGTSIVKRIVGFKPYFYVGIYEEADKKIVKNELAERLNAEVEEIKKFEPIGYQKSKKLMFKVTTTDPKEVRNLRERAKMVDGVKAVYETDILFKNRFLIDKDLGGMSWAETPDGNEINEKDIKRTEVETNAPIRIMTFDIECLPDKGKMPTSDKSPVILISMAFSPAYNGLNDLVLVGKQIDCIRKDTMACFDEFGLLASFMLILKNYDPDIIAGYNSNEFDFTYLQERAKIKQINTKWYAKKIVTQTNVTWTGKVIIDLLPILRASTESKYKLKQYTLRNVAKELLKIEKLDVDPKEIEQMWAEEGEGLKKFISYSRRDARLVMELLDEMKVVERYIEMSKASGSLLQDIANGGQSGMIENLLLRRFRKYDRVVSTKPDSEMSEDRFEENKDLKGGEVLTPEKGIIEDTVVLDYKSLYPTIMMAYNLCYSTVTDPSHGDGSEINNENLIQAPAGGGCFVDESILPGIVPEILNELLEKRIAIKKEMKKTKDEKEIAFLDAKQYALKILLNSFYGYSGYARARLYDLRIANAVTSFGRENILRTVDVIDNMKDVKKSNFNVVYGDSITKDRCVTVRNKKGMIEVIRIEELFESCKQNSKVEKIGEKEYVKCTKYDALTHKGWEQIETIMRHKTNKKIYRVNQKYGESITTEDHSYMDENLIETKPTDMNRTRMYKCKIPEIENKINSIDLYEYVKDFEYKKMYKGREKTSKFEIYNEEYLKFGWTNRKENVLVKRYIKGNDLEQLCILLGGYITNGSSTFGSRLGASICDSDVIWLEKMQIAYHTLFKNGETCIIESNKKIRTLSNGTTYKDETRKLQMMNGISAAVFTALCGHGAYEKKLPKFTYNMQDEYKEKLLEVLIEGDGSRKFSKKNGFSDKYKRNNFAYATVSIELVSGISTLISTMEIKHNINYRKEKNVYSIQTKGREEKEKADNTKTKTNITCENYNGYVYDLTIRDVHTFTDSCGNILLKNTDSVFVKVIRTEGNSLSLQEAETIGKKIAEEVTKTLPEPMELVFESFARRGILLAKKRYALWLIEPNGKDKIKVRGIETVRRDWCNLTTKTMATCLDLILKEGKVKEAIELVDRTIKDVHKLNLALDRKMLEDLTITKRYGKGAQAYKNKQPHVQLVERMKKRGSNAPSIGDRVPYVIIKGRMRGKKQKEKFVDRAEDPDYIMKMSLQVDTDYYINKQILPPVLRILECTGEDLSLLRNDKLRDGKQKTLLGDW